MINPYAVMYDATMDIYRWEEAKVDGFTEHRKNAGSFFKTLQIQFFRTGTDRGS